MAGPARPALRTAGAEARLEPARRWLAAQHPGEEVLVVAASPGAAAELCRRALGATARSAAFGWHRTTLGTLAARLVGATLAEAGRVPIGTLASEAVTARVLHDAESLGRYEPLADAPGLPAAMARTFEELRLTGADASAIEAEAPDLAVLLAAYDDALAEAGLIDRAGVLQQARALLERGAVHPLVGLPTLLLDVPLDSACERALVAALVARAPSLLATVPRGDEPARRALAEIGFEAEEPATEPPGSALEHLQRGLFGGAGDETRELDESVVVLSAPGESRECVEIARRILACARVGTPFDQIAVLLRSPEEYRPHLEEAFERAAIPAHFARGAVQPDPAGRAFLALLACAADGLSARRFAEYVSLGEVPRTDASGAPPPAPPAGERFVAADDDALPAAIAQPGVLSSPEEEPPGDDFCEPVADGTLRAPRRWERLLVEAAVIGGRERWERRLAGLERELRLDLEELEEPDGPAAGALERDLEDLAHLRAFALPLLDALAALPERASWGTWVEALGDLANRALRDPTRIAMVLSELLPMASVGPVGLLEVRLVLARRIAEVALPPVGSRHGRVFVAPAEAARGLGFEVVFVPGLAEKLFPRKIAEEPLLLDARRHRIGLPLVTNDDRVAAERRALHLAAGAAARRLFLSYPRLDLDQGRPRVPSFYALEALRAAEGRLPGFDELASRAERVADTRVGWPAPRDPADAVDDAEHDLALLERLLEQDENASVGTAAYLLSANPHLERALRFRARRWLAGWNRADGLIDPSEAARKALAAQRIAARPYSPTALQHFAACPYRFFLSAIQRLRPREEPEAIDELDPLQRGSLVHDVQFTLFGKLRDEELLPVRPASLPRARELLDGVLDATAARYRDRLAPAIPRVFEDGVAGVRGDLREWLRRASEDASGFVPWRFELAFGLTRLRERDEHSVAEPVALDCGLRVRGSIDLVERRGEHLRVTDHKTGKARFAEGAVTEGGGALQPILYALVSEKLFAASGQPVEAGRLYYCTAAGTYSEREVPLDDTAREAAAEVAHAVDRAIAEPFLPAAPAEGACRFCDYRGVCGPYEEQRTARKWPGDERLRGLLSVRELD